jgi:hypothetical protein
VSRSSGILHQCSDPCSHVRSVEMGSKGRQKRRSDLMLTFLMRSLRLWEAANLTDKLMSSADVAFTIYGARAPRVHSPVRGADGTSSGERASFAFVIELPVRIHDRSCEFIEDSGGQEDSKNIPGNATR